MTLRNWMNEHFFDSANTYKIINENGEQINIEWDEYENYEFVKYIPGFFEDEIIVK